MHLDQYVTAQEAAARLGLRYHTFLARVRRRKTWLKVTKWNGVLFFRKKDITRIKNAN